MKSKLDSKRPSPIDLEISVKFKNFRDVIFETKEKINAHDEDIGLYLKRLKDLVKNLEEDYCGEDEFETLN